MSKPKKVTIQPGQVLLITVDMPDAGDPDAAPLAGHRPGGYPAGGTEGVAPHTSHIDGPLLPVPWVSQNSPTARRSPGDCGPACLTMIVWYLTDKLPTVDEVAIACDQPAGSDWSNFGQLARGARAFGLAPTYVNPLTRNQICTELDIGRPVLALINYGQIPDNQDNYKDAHFIVIAGYNDKRVVFHDPNRLWGDDFGVYRTAPWDLFLKALGTTHELKSNTQSNQGMVFSA